MVSFYYLLFYNRFNGPINPINTCGISLGRGVKNGGTG